MKRLKNWDFVFDKNDSPIEHRKLAKSFVDFLYGYQDFFKVNGSLKIRGSEDFGSRRVITSADIVYIKRPSKIGIVDTYRICTEHFEKMRGVYMLKDAKESLYLFSPQDMQSTTANILYNSYNGYTTTSTYIQE